MGRFFQVPGRPALRSYFIGTALERDRTTSIQMAQIGATGVSRATLIEHGLAELNEQPKARG